MSPVLTRPRPRSSPALAPRQVLLIGVAVVIGVAVIVATYVALRNPASVDRLRVVNKAPYLVDVEVTGATRDGWLKLGPISPGEVHDFGSVVDQGDRWVFHITAGPHDGGEFSMTGSELERARRNVTIPDVVRARLAAAEAVPRTLP
jgi:hypothetical protein